MRVWTQEEIKGLLERSDKMVCISLVQIYNCQTEDEKLYKETSHDNGIGFNAFDSAILSSFAEQYLKNNSLSKRQIESARKKMFKYSKQITKLANEYELRNSSKYDLENFND